MNLACSKVGRLEQFLLIVSLPFLLTFAANQNGNVCYLKPYCTQSDKVSCCYEWPVHDFNELVNSNKVLYVSPGVYHLNGNMQIAAVRNFSIIGSNTKFIFNNSKPGFYFSIINSSSIHIANVQFISCGQMIEHSTNSTNRSAAVYLLDTSSVNMTNVVFQNNCGYGIIGINIAGKSVLKNITIYQSSTYAYCRHQQQFLTGGIIWLYNKIVTPNSAKLSVSNYNIHNITNNGNYSRVSSSAIILILHHQKCDVNISHVVIANLIQNSQAVKKVCGPQKGYGEKRCEIQGGGQEMAVMVG